MATRASRGTVGRPMARARQRRSWGLRFFLAFLVLLLISVAAARGALKLVAPARRVRAGGPAERRQEEGARRGDCRRDAEPIGITPSSSPSTSPGALSRSPPGTSPRSTSARARAAAPASSTPSSSSRSSTSPPRVPAARRAHTACTATCASSESPSPWRRSPITTGSWSPTRPTRANYLDPTFADVWLGASLSRNVVGGEAITLPK